MKREDLSRIYRELSEDKVSWIRDTVADALESVIQDCERYRADPQGLDIIKPNTFAKVRQALNLLKGD